MATPSLIQSNTAASNAASPTSITPTLSVASSALNFLIINVVCTGTNPTITTPAGWTLIVSSISTTLAAALFGRFQAPAGITAVAVTITATGGGAVSSIFEFEGVPALAQEYATAFQGAFGTFSYSPPAAIPDYQELTFVCYGYEAATLSVISRDQAAWSANTASTVSTNGTPNAQISNFYCVNIGPSEPVITVSIPTVTASVLIFRIRTSISYSIIGTTSNGNRGILSGSFYQGMIGG